MTMCRKYPGAHLKTVRSHIMKFFYKYFLKHSDLRERTACANSYDAFEEIIAEMKCRVVDDAEYEEVSLLFFYCAMINDCLAILKLYFLF